MRGERVFSGIVFDVYHSPVELLGGGTVEYETVACPDAVRVYPVTADKRLLMISERRQETGGDVLRVVSGRIERGENPLRAAARELREELGYEAGSLAVFATSTPMLKVHHTVHHVIARDLRKGEAELGELEDVREHDVFLAELEELVWSGAVCEDVIAFNLLRLRRLLSAEGET